MASGLKQARVRLAPNHQRISRDRPHDRTNLSPALRKLQIAHRSMSCCVATPASRAGRYSQRPRLGQVDARLPRHAHLGHLPNGFSPRGSEVAVQTQRIAAPVVLPPVPLARRSDIPFRKTVFAGDSTSVRSMMGSHLSPFPFHFAGIGVTRPQMQVTPPSVNTTLCARSQLTAANLIGSCSCPGGPARCRPGGVERACNATASLCLAKRDVMQGAPLRCSPSGLSANAAALQVGWCTAHGH